MVLFVYEINTINKTSAIECHGVPFGVTWQCSPVTFEGRRITEKYQIEKHRNTRKHRITETPTSNRFGYGTEKCIVH